MWSTEKPEVPNLYLARPTWSHDRCDYLLVDIDSDGEWRVSGVPTCHEALGDYEFAPIEPEE